MFRSNKKYVKWISTKHNNSAAKQISSICLSYELGLGFFV